jgi:hypothetical protein
LRSGVRVWRMRTGISIAVAVSISFGRVGQVERRRPRLHAVATTTQAAFSEAIVEFCLVGDCDGCMAP